MLDAQQEVRKLLDVMLASPANSQTAQRASDQIQVICRAYMELDQGSEGYAIGLSTSKAKMFDLLLARRGQTVSRQALMDSCSHGPDNEPDIKILDVHMAGIRKKLHATRYEIETIWGIGYRMKPAQPN